MSTDTTVNRFRAQRGRVLAAHLDRLAAQLGRSLTILDVGGRPDYWDNIGLAHVSKVVIMNYDQAETDRASRTQGIFESTVGDARDLSDYADGSIDVVHSNSVIEHVGLWPEIERMAAEVRRVGRHGWVQTPAYEFPIEPHFRLPMAHWVGAPTRARLLRLSPHYRTQTPAQRRGHVDRINLLSKSEMETLFPGADFFVERLGGLPKSYTAMW